MRLSMRRVVALEGAAAVVTAGFALDAWPLFALGAAGAVAALLRWRGRWATTHLVAALRRTPKAGPPADLGLVARLVPGLSVVEHRDRNDIPVGIVRDGHGLATVLELRTGALDVPDLTAWLAGDRTHPAGLQLLTELHFPPAWRTPAAESYRQLPSRGHPVAARAWLVVRHEPLWTLTEVEARGGGVAGANAAATSATLRLADHLARQGIPATPLPAAAVRGLLRELGETGDAEALRGAWVGPEVVHCSLAATATWDALTAALRHAGVPRVITSLVLTGRTAFVRLIGPAEQVWHARAAILKSGVVRSMFDGQSEGMVATLPLGRPTRRRADVLGLVRR
jgi:type VII secretion protein EccE